MPLAQPMDSSPVLNHKRGVEEGAPSSSSSSRGSVGLEHEGEEEVEGGSDDVQASDEDDIECAGAAKGVLGCRMKMVLPFGPVSKLAYDALNRFVLGSSGGPKRKRAP